VNAEVAVNRDRINHLIGKEIPENTLRQILASLDIEILSEEGNNMLLRIPPYRVDVHREADVVEEVLRIYGFNNVEVPDRVHATLSYVTKPDKEKITHTVCDFLTGAGVTEIMSNSLTRSAYYKKNKPFPSENLVRILNPLSSDLDCMRQSLLYGGLEAIRYNRNRKNPDLLLYEVGKVYFYHPETKAGDPLSKYSEYMHLALFATGNRNEKNWTTPEQPVDFFFLYGWVAGVLQRLGFDPEHLENEEVNSDVFEYGLKYMVEGTVVAEFGEVNTRLTAEFDCKVPVFYADFHWDALINLVKNHWVIYREVPRFPEVRRDLSMVLDEKVTYAQLRELAFGTEKKLLRSMNLFDVYKGDKIGAGKKSYAITYVLQDPSKTLTDEEIDAVMKKLMTAYEKELGAVIRQ
jgi:phenylalanyl-tRNA synthetase beta chain